MSEYENFAAEPIVEIDGKKLSDDEKLSRLNAVRDRFEVEDHLSLPDSFVLRFRDPRLETGYEGGPSAFDEYSLRIGSKVKISAQPLGKGDPELLIEGEVTAIEGMYDARGGHIAIRGQDKYHRLHRGRKTEAYKQETDGGLVRAIAAEAGLSVGRVDDPSNVSYEEISRFNQTAAEFMGPIARAHDRELRVVTNGTAQLAYQSHGEASEGPDPVSELTEGPPPAHELKYGNNLQSFSPRVASPQHKQVQARGWDWDKKAGLISPTEQVIGTNAELRNFGDDPASLAGKFGSSTYLHAGPHDHQAEVDVIAATLAAQIGSTFAEADATILGMPVRAGDAVSVDGVSEPFAGKWTVSSSRHVFDSTGYRTHLILSGAQDRTLYGLIAHASETGLAGGGSPINGVVVGIVTDINDPRKLGRVKVKFPWMSDGDTAYVSTWARVVQDGAGPDRGQVVLPEKDDEVLVAFFLGDPQYPYVLGGLYNGQDKADPGPFEVVDSSGKMNWRGFISRGKHRLVFSDKENDEYIELSTKEKKYMLKLDQGKTQIEITSDGKITITGKQDITINGDANIKVEAKTNLDEKAGGNVKIEATGNLELKGAMVKIEASGNLDVKGAMVNVQGSGPVAVKGTPIQLN